MVPVVERSSGVGCRADFPESPPPQAEHNMIQTPMNIGSKELRTIFFLLFL
jgi:hypothetical protein